MGPGAGQPRAQGPGTSAGGRQCTLQGRPGGQLNCRASSKLRRHGAGCTHAGSPGHLGPGWAWTGQPSGSDHVRACRAETRPWRRTRGVRSRGREPRI
eukprot:5083700-Pyramimonas_sp.AAC.1